MQLLLPMQRDTNLPVYAFSLWYGVQKDVQT